MNDIRIIAEDLGKRYLRRTVPSGGFWHRLVRGPWRGPQPDPFWALRGVSFTVGAGEMLGVIGPNGAGKSTLLTLLSGLARPTTGRASVNGRIGALLELGGGFVDDLTGRENTLLAGVVAGLTRAEVQARLERIVAFAEIEGFFDDPVRTYSTGMRMRLAFAVVVHTDPDVLLVDEFLAVGDLSFQAKCRARIGELLSAGSAVVLVSHGLGEVRDTCQRVLWLREGGVVAFDTAETVTARYEAEMHERTLQRTPSRRARQVIAGRGGRGGGDRLGSREMEIVGVELRPGPVLLSGQPFAVDLRYRTRRKVPPPIFGISITREDGSVCLDTNTESARFSLENLPAAGRIRFSIRRLELGAGRYFVNVGIFDGRWSHAYDYHWHVHPLAVEGATEHKGVLAPPCRWEAALPSASALRADEEALK